MVERDLALYVK